MSSMVLSGDTSGQVTLTVPAVAGTNTITLPAATGTVMVSGNQPAFSAYQSSAQSVSNTTNTKVQFQTKTFDTASCYDNATNYRFTPTVAGYYQITGAVTLNLGASITTAVYSAIYKNGSEYQRGNTAGGSLNPTSVANGLIYLNGSTDYVEIYVYQNFGIAQNTYNVSSLTWFNGAMVRAA